MNVLTATEVYKSPGLRVTGKGADSGLALQCWNRMCGLQHPLLSGVSLGYGWLLACRGPSAPEAVDGVGLQT